MDTIWLQQIAQSQKWSHVPSRTILGAWRGTIVLVSDWIGLARHCFLLVPSKIFSVSSLACWLPRPTPSLSLDIVGNRSVVMCLLRYAILEQSSRCLLWLWHEWTAVGDQPTELGTDEPTSRPVLVGHSHYITTSTNDNRVELGPR